MIWFNFFGVIICTNGICWGHHWNKEHMHVALRLLD